MFIVSALNNMGA